MSSERVINFISGERLVIDEFLEMKNTTQIKSPHAHAAPWLRDPRSNCLNTPAGKPFTDGQVIVGEEMIAGYRTVKIAMGNSTSWFALDCDCAMLKVRTDFGRQGVSEQTAIAIIPGEPSETFFRVPETFREVSRAEMRKEQKQDNRRIR